MCGPHPMPALDPSFIVKWCSEAILWPDIWLLDPSTSASSGLTLSVNVGGDRDLCLNATSGRLVSGDWMGRHVVHWAVLLGDGSQLVLNTATRLVWELFVEVRGGSLGDDGLAVGLLDLGRSLLDSRLDLGGALARLLLGLAAALVPLSIVFGSFSPFRL